MPTVGGPTPIINYDKDILDPLLRKLMGSVDNQLREVQKFKCPRYIDINLVEIPSKIYRYMENDYVSQKRIFKVNNNSELVIRNLSSAYSGPLKTLIDNENLKPFILFLNNNFIKWSNINCIMDDKNMYLEINNLDTINDDYGDIGEPISITSGNSCMTRFQSIDPSFNNFIEVQITCLDPSKLSKLVFNGVNISTPKSIIGNVVTYTIPSAAISPTQSDYCECYIHVNANTQIYKMKMYSTQNATPEIASVNTLLINNKVVYSETTSSKSIPANSKFTFKEGRSSAISESLALSSFRTCICFDFPFFFENSSAGSSKIHSNFGALDSKYKLFKENIITFFRCRPNDSNGNMTEKGANIFEMATNPNGFNTFYKVFYYYDQQTIDKYLDIQKKYDIANIIKSGGALPSFMGAILPSIEFTYDSNIPYEDNMGIFLSLIAQYDSSLLNDYIRAKSEVISKTYTGLQIKNIGTINGLDTEITVSKNINGKFNNGVIVFKNGLLFNPARVIDLGNHYKIKFITSALSNTDKIELMWFKNIENSDYVINVSDQNDITQIPNYSLTSPMLFSSDYQTHLFDIAKKSELQYRIPAKINLIDSKSFKVIMNPYFYNKDINMVSSRKFVYGEFPITALDNGMAKIQLDTKFKFCSNINQYLLFTNGRMMNPKTFELIINDTGLPFEERAIYLNKKLQVGDVVSVFYLPVAFMIREQPTMIDANGHIDYNNSSSIAGVKNFHIFTNGKKVFPDDIAQVSQTKGRVKVDTQSLLNVYVLDPVTYYDDAMNIIASTADLWDTAASLMTPTELEYFTGAGVPMTNSETDINSNSYDRNMILYEMIRRYFISSDSDKNVDAAMHFQYGYAEEIGMIIEPVNEGDNLFNVTTDSGATYESYSTENSNIPEDILESPFDKPIFGIKKTNNIGFVEVEFNKLDPLPPDTKYSLSVWIYMDYPNNQLFAKEYRGSAPDGVNSGTLKYKSTIPLQTAPLNKWIRLSLDDIQSSNDSIKVSLSSKIFDLNNRIFFTNPVIEKQQFGDGVKIIVLDAAQTQINFLP